MLRRGFDELGLPRIVAVVDVRNVASERVMRKLGMRHTASGTHGEIALRGYAIDRAEFTPRPAGTGIAAS
jgi:RimJ/RimL family protein N-acetyltransferase